jgi:NAD dependent epimerase/dehydratase family enzyme
VLTHDELTGPVNLVAPNPVLNQEFVDTLGRVLARPTKLPTPLAPLKVLYGKELVDLLLLASQRVVPAKLQASGFPFAHPTLEGALRSVLHKPAAA